MQVNGHVQAIRDDLARVAAVGDEAMARTAEVLALALEPSISLHLQEALAEAALELATQLPEGRVEVRVAGGDPELVYVDAGRPGRIEPTEEAYRARITLRLPESLKSRLETAAATAGMSVNTWLVQTLTRVLEPRPSASSGPHRLTGYGRS
jgi:hypothetical protein